MRERWVSLRQLVRLTVTASPWLASAELLLVALTAVAAPLQAYGAAQVVDSVATHRSISQGAALLFGALAISFVGLVATDSIRHRLEDRIDFTLQQELLQLLTGLPGINHHEQPEIADRVGAVREDVRRLRGTAGTIGGGLTVVVSTAAVLTLLAGVDPLLLFLPVVGLVRLWASASGARGYRDAMNETVVHSRRIKWLEDIVGSPRHGLEIRAFGLRNLLTDRIAHEFVLQNEPRWRAMRRRSLLEIAARVFFGIAYGGAIVYVVWLAQRGRATAGDVAMVLLLAPQTDQAAQRLADSVWSLVGMLDVAGHVTWLRLHIGGQLPPAGTARPPGRLHHGIELRQVSFGYLGSDRSAVQGLNVVLPAGSTVALVGDNGAGKTTLVKLLTRMYEPSSGSIAIDGVDLRDLDHKAWRSRISVGFQDFVRYEYTAREAIGLGEPSTLHSFGDTDSPDQMESYDAAIEAGDARRVVDGLRNGLATRLGARFGGVELSGGQWQRLALARTFLRERPLLVILDEPAASLDPESEHALIERFNDASGQTRLNGGITLLVSHRLSTVRMADLILVFDKGRVAEMGRHDDLVAARGLYAELFEMQAKAYG
jgi:ATP-binding cassette subfamily B protein